MGLSSSKSKTETNQQQSAAQTPITPEWLLQGARDYTQRIGDFGNMDPNQFVAGASPLQQQAWSNVRQLDGWQPQAAAAAEMAAKAGASGPNLAGKGSDPRSFIQSGAAGPQPLVAAPPRDSSTLPTNGYSPAPNMTGYALPRTGNPIGVSANAYGYQAGQTATPTIDPTTNAVASGAHAASLLDNFGAYQSPYTQQVVDTTLAGYDQNAGRTRAMQEAAAARTGAFGGSRNAITRSMTEGELAQNRAGLEAGLRDQGFNTAAQLSQSDATNRQQASMFNAQNQTQNSQFNAGNENARALNQAQLGMTGNLASQAAMNAAGQFGANAQNNASQFNAGQGNQMMQFNAGQEDNAQQRALAAAALMSQQANDYNSNTRADLGVMSSFGNDQRAIEQAYASAPLAQLQAIGSLSGLTPYQILVGQQTDGSSSGTSVTRATPSLFDQLMKGAQVASAFL